MNEKKCIILKHFDFWLLNFEKKNNADATSDAFAAPIVSVYLIITCAPM